MEYKQSNIIHINSLHRTAENETSSNFNINLGNSTITQNVTATYIRSISFCNCVYNINQYCNTFWYSLDNITYTTVTVPVGQYTLQELLDELTTQLGLAGVTIVFSINTITKKVSVSSCVPDIYTFDWNNVNGVDTDHELGQKLGIVGKDLLLAGTTFTNLPDLSGLTQLFIRSAALASGRSLDVYSRPTALRTRPTRTVLSDCVEVIGVNASHGSFVHHDNVLSENIITYDKTRGLSSIDIRLVDEKGRDIDFNGSNVSIILEVMH